MTAMSLLIVTSLSVKALEYHDTYRETEIIFYFYHYSWNKYY